MSDPQSPRPPRKLPEQVPRLAVLLFIVVVALLAARHFLVPSDFGTIGHYRASAIDSIAAHPISYAGQAVCVECHSDVSDARRTGNHKTVACEVCHGPSAAHAEDPGSIKPPAPRDRRGCPMCHEYLPSRPTGFPQIVSASHNPMKPCIVCHNPHDPKPPVTPKECDACHAAIARTKSLSHHFEIPCTRCHETPEAHKTNPRAALPSKPETREFCGGCHGTDAEAPKEIPRIDLATHGERYVCWQCHYPHLPEAR